MQSVYIETTIPSYLTSKPSNDVVIAGHQQTTAEWWQKRRAAFDLYTSQFVFDEARLGDPVLAGRRIEILSSLKLLTITDEIRNFGSQLLREGALPEAAKIDALHIAVSAVNRIEYLLTWNCAHLANAALFKKIQIVCQKNGYACPIICTPEELMEE